MNNLPTEGTPRSQSGKGYPGEEVGERKREREGGREMKKERKEKIERKGG